MRKFRVIKIIVALTLTVTIFLCSSVFASAYIPLFKHDSSEWTAISDDMLSAKYPSSIKNYPLNEIVYSYPEYNDQTYYMSLNWNDDFYVDDHKEVMIPSVPKDYSPSFGEDVSSSDVDKAVFKIGNNLYLACLIGNYNFIYLDSNNVFTVDVAGCTGEVVFYSLTYPYTEWTYHGYGDYYFNDDNLGLPFLPGVEGFQPCSIVWSTVDVYDYLGESIIHESDINTFFGSYIIVEYASPISVLEGSLGMYVPADDFEQISNTLSAFVFDKVGFILGSKTSFIDINYSMTVRQGQNLLYYDTIMDYNFNTVRSDGMLPVGTHSLDTITKILDYSDIDITGQDVNVVVTFSFVTDGYNLFFPGNIELVEYASYEDQVQHEEVLGAIDNAVDKILNTTQDPEKIKFDSAPLEDYMEEQDEIVNNIYSDLDEDIQDSLPDGYGDHNIYLEDNIDYFNKNLNSAFSFIKSLFEAFVDATGQTYIILFCLSFGFAIYVLGRRLS